MLDTLVVKQETRSPKGDCRLKLSIAGKRSTMLDSMFIC